jgi:hypothetical protein
MKIRWIGYAGSVGEMRNSYGISTCKQEMEDQFGDLEVEVD